MEYVLKYLLPAAYTLLLGWIFWKNAFLRKHGIHPFYSLGFALGKMGIGLLYTWIMIRYIPSAKADIDSFFGGGLEWYREFLRDPIGFPAYLANIFTITDFGLGSTDSDFIRTVFDGIRFIHFFLNFFSGGELYTNIILFNGLAAWVFLRCWIQLRNMTGSWIFGAWIYLFPSAFFFTSVILKEGIELVIISAILPLLYRLRKRASLAGVFLAIILFALLFFFKYLIAATFCATLFLYYLFQKYPRAKFAISLAAVILFVSAFFTIGKIHPSLNLPQYIVDRRDEFLKLEANTELHMRELTDDAGSFFRVLPEALFNVFFRPVPGEVEKPFYYGFMLEVYGLWFLIIGLAIFCFKLKKGTTGTEAWAYLLFSLVNLVIIGYTITNTGAIIRYRSIFLPGIGYFFWVWFRGGTFLNLLKGYLKF